MTTADHISAHPRCSHHRAEVLASVRCGCFYCGAVFPPADIEEWVDDWSGVGETAMCPRCGIDAVIGSESGYPITRAFLATMHTHWFARPTRIS